MFDECFRFMDVVAGNHHHIVCLTCRCVCSKHISLVSMSLKLVDFMISQTKTPSKLSTKIFMVSVIADCFKPNFLDLKKGHLHICGPRLVHHQDLHFWAKLGSLGIGPAPEWKLMALPRCKNCAVIKIWKNLVIQRDETTSSVTVSPCKHILLTDLELCMCHVTFTSMHSF